MEGKAKVKSEEKNSEKTLSKNQSQMSQEQKPQILPWLLEEAHLVVQPAALQGVYPGDQIHFEHSNVFACFLFFCAFQHSDSLLSHPSPLPSSSILDVALSIYICSTLSSL